MVIAKVMEGKKDFGYNAKNGEYTDMIKAGIIDPKKVTRVALENAASVSGMILTTENPNLENEPESNTELDINQMVEYVMSKEKVDLTKEELIEIYDTEIEYLMFIGIMEQ